ncbi:hypothetical protein L9F63_007731, partial [Diploptera punctata]
TSYVPHHRYKYHYYNYFPYLRKANLNLTCSRNSSKNNCVTCYNYFTVELHELCQK